MAGRAGATPTGATGRGAGTVCQVRVSLSTTGGFSTITTSGSWQLKSCLSTSTKSSSMTCQTLCTPPNRLGRIRVANPKATGGVSWPTLVRHDTSSSGAMGEAASAKGASKTHSTSGDAGLPEPPPSLNEQEEVLAKSVTHRGAVHIASLLFHGFVCSLQLCLGRDTLALHLVTHRNAEAEDPGCSRLLAPGYCRPAYSSPCNAVGICLQLDWSIVWSVWWTGPSNTDIGPTPHQQPGSAQAVLWHWACHLRWNLAHSRRVDN